jgi:hypothetical protein
VKPSPSSSGNPASTAQGRKHDAPVGMTAAAEQDYQAVQDHLTALVRQVQQQLRHQTLEVRVCTDLCAALLRSHSPLQIAVLAATASIRLAKLG